MQARLAARLEEELGLTLSAGKTEVRRSLAGWLGHARFANTYDFRRRLLGAVRLRRGAGAPAAPVPGARGGMNGPPTAAT